MAAIVIAFAYLAAAAVVTALPLAAGSEAWLALHLALAGAASTAIAGLVPFFSAALAAAPPADARLRAAAIGAVGVGSAGVAVGVSAGGGALGVGGGALFASGLLLTGLAAVQPLRRGLGPGRGLVIRAYLAALLNVVVGAMLATLFLAGWSPVIEAWAGLRPAHAWLNLVGFVSLVIATTLLHFLPTVLGTRILATRSARLTVAGLALGAPLVAGGQALGWDVVTRAGAALVLAGALGLATYTARVWRRRARWTGDLGWHRFAGLGLVSAVAWFEVGMALAAGRVLIQGNASALPAAGVLAGPLVVGWVALSVVASATHLVPAVGPGDPSTHARQRRLLGRLSTTRLVAANGGIAALWLGPTLHFRLLERTGFVLVGAALAASGLLLAAAIWVAGRLYPASVALRRLTDLRLVEQIASLGVAPEDDPDTRLRKGTLTLTAASIGVLAFAWTLTYAALDRPLAAAIPLTYQLAAFASLLLLARTKRYDVFRVLQVLLMLVLPVLLQWTLGGFVGGSAVLVWASVAPLGALVFGGIRPALAAFAAFVGLVVLSSLIDPALAEGAEPLPVPLIRAFFALNILGVAAVTFLVLVYFVRERQRALDELDVAHRDLQAEQRNLEVEQEHSEALLRNVLPDAVARRLKDGAEVIADGYAAVTVLFVDVVGFTPLAARLAPEELVRLLDRVFSELDALSERHGLEKIKTVGDSYIAVAGLPDPLAAEVGARAAAEMALEVFPAVARAVGGAAALRVRVGMHTGPVVAGVIGRRKFAYDLWGDAVNVASRMESQGLPDRIQVSLDTWQLLQRHYRFRYRGTLEVRGRGEMATYLLLGRREDPTTPDHEADVTASGQPVDPEGTTPRA